MLSQESLVWLRIFGYWYRRLSAFSLFQPEHNGTLKLANSRNATDLSTKLFPSTHEKRKGKKKNKKKNRCIHMLWTNHDWFSSRCSPCFLLHYLWSSWGFLCMSVGYNIDRLTEATYAAIASHVPYHHIAVSCTCGKDD